MSNKDMLIFNLNKALQLEYSDVFLYPREAKLIVVKRCAMYSRADKSGLGLARGINYEDTHSR